MDLTRFQRLGAVFSLLAFGLAMVAMYCFSAIISKSELAVNAVIGVVAISTLGLAYFVPRAVISFRKKRAGDSWRIFW
jgi:hypothetical protein